MLKRSPLHHATARVLRQLAKKHAGSLRSAARQVGYHDRHLSSFASGKSSLTIDQISRYLTVLQVPLGDFLRDMSHECIGKEDSMDSPHSLVALLPTASVLPDPELTLLLRFLKNCQAPKRHEVRPPSLEIHPRSRKIDLMTAEDAEQAARTWILELTLHFQRGKRPFPHHVLESIDALGVWGTQMRRCDKHEQAAFAFREALRLCEHLHLSPTFVRLAQRVAYLLRDFGQHQDGLSLLGQAAQSAQVCCLEIEAGRLLVDHGILWFDSERYWESSTAFSAALKRLPGSEDTNILAAYQGLLRSQVNLGVLEAAEATLLQLKQNFPKVEGSPAAHVRWAEAELAAKQQKDQLAYTLFTETLELAKEVCSPTRRVAMLLHFGFLLDRIGKRWEFAEHLRDMIRVLENHATSRPAQMILLELHSQLGQTVLRQDLQNAVAQLREAQRRRLRTS